MKVMEPFALIKELKKKINIDDKRILLITFILGIINNFTFIITNGIAADTLSEPYFNIAGEWEISLGRFGIQFVDLIRFGLVNKLIIVLFSLFFLACSVIVITRIFNIKNKIAIFFISAVVAIAPQFTETYFFIYCADSYCLAFLLSTLAVYFLKKAEKGKKYYWVISSICTIIVCSLYQAYLGVIIGLTILLLVKYVLDNEDIKSIFIKFIKYMLTIFISIVVYYILLKVIIAIMGISLASYKGANSLGIDTIKSLPKSILHTYTNFFNFFFTNKIINNSYWKREIISSAIFINSIIGIIVFFVKNKSNKKYLKVILLMFLLSIFPIGINIMDVIAPTKQVDLITGAGLITSIIIVFLTYDKLENDTIENIIKYVYIVMLTMLVLTFLLQNTYTYMCREQTYRNYYTISSNIYNTATQLENYTEDKKWLFSNVIKFKAKDREKANGFISNNNETWEHYGGTLQNEDFFEKYLGVRITVCSVKEYIKITQTEEFKNMPVYPNNGSIKIIDDVVVIKISNKVFKY